MCKKKRLNGLLLLIGLCYTAQLPVRAFSLKSAMSGATAKIKPIVGFFTNFVTMVANSLKNADYNDQLMVMYDQQPAVDATSTRYSMAYDFGFRGGGDIEQPFGFTFDALGRYRSTPMTAMLLPGVIPDMTDPTGQKKKPLSLGDGFAPEMIKGLLSLVVGGRANAEKIWAPVAYFLKVSPETMFLLKIIILLNTARKNTSLSKGLKSKYPTLVDVPYELMMLIFRLVITPDIEETKKLNPGVGVDKSFRWEKVVTVSRPSKLLSKMPKFLVDVLNAFKPTVDSSEIQEYKDRFASPISDMQMYYSEVRLRHPYEVRITYARDNVIDRINTKTFNPSDKELLEYMIQQIVSERYRGLKTFISSMEVGKTTVTDEDGTIDSSADSRAMTDVTLVSVDVTRMIDFLGRRIPKIKNFIAYLLSPEKKDLWSQELRGYLDAIATSIDAEFDALSKMAADLTDARKALVQARMRDGNSFSEADPTRVLEQRIASSILDKLDAISAQETGQLGKMSGVKVPVPLPAYLDLKFWQAMRMMRQGFKGDKNFLMADAQLSIPKALMHAYAICFRANMDLLYLEDLIKTDSRSFVVKTNTGQTLTGTGIQLYRSYMDAERYLLYCQNKVSTYRASMGKLTAEQLLKDPQMAGLQKDADNASVLYGRARSAFRYQLRQFEFDRRIPRAKKVSKVLMGESSMEGLGDVNIVSVSQDAVVPAVQPAEVAATSAAPEKVVAEPAKIVAPVVEEKKVVADDPFAVFGSTDTGAATSGAVAVEDPDSGDSSVLSLDDQPFKNPVFDSDPAAIAPVQGSQGGFMGVAPQKYDYARTVNSFVSQEFARLMLRCPQFQEHANAQLDQMVFQMTGMRINQLLQAASGETSDVEMEEDKEFLPGEDFFSKKVSLADVGSTDNAVDMDALGKELADKYGIDVSAEADAGGPQEEDATSSDNASQDESVSTDSFSDDAPADLSVADALAQEPIDGVSDAFASMADEPAVADLSESDQQSLDQEASSSSSSTQESSPFAEDVPVQSSETSFQESVSQDQSSIQQQPAQQAQYFDQSQNWGQQQPVNTQQFDQQQQFGQQQRFNQQQFPQSQQYADPYQQQQGYDQSQFAPQGF